jgi:hypothetical protein
LQVSRRQIRIISNVIFIVLISVSIGIAIDLYKNTRPEHTNEIAKNFEIRQNEYFSANATIINNVRFDYAVANDELFYNISYRKVIDDVLKLEPELVTLYGGKEIGREIMPEIILYTNEQTNTKFRLFLNQTGLNQIVLEVNVFKRTENNDEWLDMIPTTINIENFSLSDKNDQISNQKQAELIQTSTFIGIMTVFALLVNVIITKGHLDEITKQGFDHNRSWIGIDDTVSEQLKIEDEATRIYLKNHGNLLAKNVTVWFYVSETKITSASEIVAKGCKEESIDVAPRETFLQTIKHPNNKKKEELETFYIGLNITYHHPNRSERGESTIVISIDNKNKNDEFTIRKLD